ncbi:rve-domain-containing protein [Dichomitus squalens LYAD-421 SS1]|uniref:Rve-domain-containing protein n=1 Tax=Dichomitus squalens (strain LYAD-421) TaxID=732165 RepID=R7SJJ1_DICSQ|nr:rve-domain-containing protein [Dichomitus squalens LYAD-421 SS1]EJF56314.1 rve-domain-containing protein [Dichomitus squalens LYAD-421 SS1]
MFDACGYVIGSDCYLSHDYVAHCKPCPGANPFWCLTTYKLISLGALLKDGLEARASTAEISFYQNDRLIVAFKPRFENDTIYVTHTQPRSARYAVAASNAVDYETLHCCFAHPSRDVLKHARKRTEKCPLVEFSLHDSICRGCAEGKMPSQPHPLDIRRATRPFELIHSDLKDFPVPSYHKYKHRILYFDDYTSHVWTIGLRTKAAALQVTRQWLAYVENQFNAKVQKWKSDSAGELKSTAFTDMLKDRGIERIPSAPNIHEQNGRAEQIIRTIMEKGEAMRHDACIPQSWWEFSFEHAAHVYNRTPMQRLNWRTPYEVLHGSKPDISHLRVFGRGAYVFLPRGFARTSYRPSQS